MRRTQGADRKNFGQFGVLGPIVACFCFLLGYAKKCTCEPRVPVNLFCFCMMMFSEYRGQISTVLCCFLVRQMSSVVYNLWYQPKINARKLGIFGTKKGHINCGGHVL